MDRLSGKELRQHTEEIRAELYFLRRDGEYRELAEAAEDPTDRMIYLLRELAAGTG